MRSSYTKKYDRGLIEADGSRGKPLKASNNSEPVMVAATDLLIGVIGMSVLGQIISEACVHRSELFSQLTGSGKGQPVSKEIIARLINRPEGLFKNTPVQAKKLLLLNQVDDDMSKRQAKEIAKLLRKGRGIKTIYHLLVASFDPKKYELIWSETL